MQPLINFYKHHKLNNISQGKIKLREYQLLSQSFSYSIIKELNELRLRF